MQDVYFDLFLYLLGMRHAIECRETWNEFVAFTVNDELILPYEKMPLNRPISFVFASAQQRE